MLCTALPNYIGRLQSCLTPRHIRRATEDRRLRQLTDLMALPQRGGCRRCQTFAASTLSLYDVWQP